MRETVIQVKGLRKSFKNTQVLKGVGFEVRRGEIFALLGSNGAGKTTTIKILCTLLRPDCGSAAVCGYDVIQKPDKVRESISLTGQNAAVDNVLTGRENLRLIGKLRHLSDANRKADELLERFDLLDAADRRVSTYSGGMRRRLDLAMGLLGTPAVVFLDEPTTGLDPQSRIAMWDIIKGLGAAGITVLLTTQYLEEAEQLADQIAILNEGKIVAHGTSAELKKLLPVKHIELKFHSENDLLRAKELMQDESVSLDEKNQVLIVTTDGSIRHMTGILNRLESAVQVAEFAQKQPTLEDVFLTVIGANKEKEEVI